MGGEGKAARASGAEPETETAIIAQLKEVQKAITRNKMELEYILTLKSIFEYGPQFFGPRDSREGVLSQNKCHHVLSRILFDPRIHSGDISNTIHKYF